MMLAKKTTSNLDSSKNVYADDEIVTTETDSGSIKIKMNSESSQTDDLILEGVTKPDLDFKNRAKAVSEHYGKCFIKEILPKLPKLPNGMTLLGANEQSPLINCGEIYKVRVYRPDEPVAHSEVFEDNCTVRFTNISRLMNDDLIIAKFKIETATFKVGPVDEDQVGTDALKGLYEAEDVGSLTFKPFIERKIKELVMLSLEIAVTKKLREAEVRDIKERCLSMYGGKCNMVDDGKVCSICMIRDEVKEVTCHFEGRDKVGSGKVWVWDPGSFIKTS